MREFSFAPFVTALVALVLVTSQLEPAPAQIKPAISGNWFGRGLASAILDDGPKMPNQAILLPGAAEALSKVDLGAADQKKLVSRLIQLASSPEPNEAAPSLQAIATMEHVDPTQRVEIISLLIRRLKEPLSEANSAAISSMQAVGRAKSDSEEQRKSILAALEDVASDDSRLPSIRQLAAQTLMEFTGGDPREIGSVVARKLDCIKQPSKCDKVAASTAAMILGNLAIEINEANGFALALMDRFEASTDLEADQITAYLFALSKVAAKLDVSTKESIAQRLLKQISSEKSSVESDLALSALSILPTLYSDELKAQTAIKIELLRRIDEESDPRARVVAIAAISRIVTSDGAFQIARFKKLRGILDEHPKGRNILNDYGTSAQAEALKSLSAIDSLTSNQAEEIARLLVRNFGVRQSETLESLASRDALNQLGARYPATQSKVIGELLRSVPVRGSTFDDFRPIFLVAAVARDVEDDTFSRLATTFSSLGESGKDQSGYTRTALAKALVNLARNDKGRKGMVAQLLMHHLHSDATRQPVGLLETTIDALNDVGLPPGADRDSVLETLVGYLRPGTDGQISRAITTFGPIGAKAIAQLFLLMNLDAPTEERTAFWRARAIAYTGILDERQDGWFLIHAFGRPQLIPWDAVLEHSSERLSQLNTYWPGNDAPGAKGLQSEFAAGLLELVRRNCASETMTPPSSDLLSKLKELAAEEVSSTLRWLINLASADKAGRCWSFSDRQELRRLERKLISSGRTNERQLLSASIREDEKTPVLGLAIAGYVVWSVPSIALLLLFPYVPTIRRLYLFNDNIRNLLSLGWISLIVQVSPILRRRLLAPFRDSLLATAELEEFDPYYWYSDLKLVDKSRQCLSLREFALGATGTAVIIGESGLGKTTLLRFIASQDARPTAFLAAEDCSKGVIEAIIERTQNLAGPSFFNFLVQSGDLRVFIDSLNEAAPETRATIFKFANNPGGKRNILITTQPLEAINMQEMPLSGARSYELQQLGDDEIENFLLTRPARNAKDSLITGAEYDKLVRRLLAEQFEAAVSDERKIAVREIFSNPMDLTYASELISRGEVPIAEDMIGQAFTLAKSEYSTYAKMEFPTSGFAKKAVELRELDRNWFYEDEFKAEQEILSKYKLLSTRSSYNSEGKEVVARMFRHGKVWDYFIFLAFQEEKSLRQRHLVDFRFRGSYLLFAHAADIEQARILGDQIVRRAARTRDHSLSDEYMRRLMSRETAYPSLQ